MQLNHFSRSLAFILGLTVMWASGCSRSPAPRFYTLNPVQEQAVFRSASGRQNPVVGVGPVKFPDYLDQAQIVTRTGDNQVVRGEFNRWAGPLKNNFINVLAENIGSLLPTDRIQLFPWRLDTPVDYQVRVEVVRFDGRLGEEARLESRWSILQGPDQRLVKAGRSSISEPVAGPEYADLVAAQSRALARLSQEIVQGLRGAGRN